jgi:hypothetical protein
VAGCTGPIGTGQLSGRSRINPDRSQDHMIGYREPAAGRRMRQDLGATAGPVWLWPARRPSARFQLPSLARHVYPSWLMGEPSTGPAFCATYPASKAG